MKYAKSVADERRQLLTYLDLTFEGWSSALGLDELGIAFSLEGIREVLRTAERGDHVLDADELAHPFAVLGELGADPTIYREAIDTFGESAQALMVVEECAELLACFAKRQRGRVELEDLASEVADVLIVVLQFAELLGPGLVVQAIANKRDRLRDRIDARSPEDVPLAPCPGCGAALPDHDGFGVLAHEDCGYCSHPTGEGEDCPSCSATGVRRIGGHDYTCSTCNGRGYVVRCGVCSGLSEGNNRWGGT